MSAQRETGLASTGTTNRRSTRGTTLVELMIGLSILVILAGLATPGLASLIRSHNLRTAADDLVYGANLARGQAASNRRAYFLVFSGLAPAGCGLHFSVVQGTGSSCSTMAGGLAIYTADYGAGNTFGNERVDITAFAPAELLTAGGAVCFKPDGRVLRADTGMYFSAPASTTLEAGDVVLQLQRSEGVANRVGTAVQVRIGYNGTARITFGLPMDQLQ